MKKTLFVIIVYVFCNSCSVAQKTDQYTIVSYNVENLFDTSKTSGKDDIDYTPDGKKKWNTEKYFSKLKNIAKVISSIDSCGCPAIVGLEEVENKKVMEDLISMETLSICKYSIIHFESGDPRGIDNALLYRNDFLTIIIQKSFPVRFGDEQAKAMRDMLYVKGVSGKDTLHFFVIHWKSRSDGVSETEPKRLNDAICLKNKTDSLLKDNENAKIIIMGDFNDNPTDKSIIDVLDAFSAPPATPTYLYNPFYTLYKKGIGSYIYKGEWFLYDQIIISGGLNDATSDLKFNTSDTNIFNPDWLYYTDNTENKKPSMFYSDHFPVYIVIEKKE